jgi:hypothetical protein
VRDGGGGAEAWKQYQTQCSALNITLEYTNFAKYSALSAQVLLSTCRACTCSAQGLLSILYSAHVLNKHLSASACTVSGPRTTMCTRLSPTDLP